MPDTEGGKRVRILFVDDEELSRKYFARVFGFGREIVTAGNGREALEVHEAEAGSICIVVTDQIMPRLTGLAVLRHLRDEGSPVVRILSTGSVHGDSELVQEAERDGVIDFFLSKPWDLEEVEAVLCQAERCHAARLDPGGFQGQVA